MSSLDNYLFLLEHQKTLVANVEIILDVHESGNDIYYLAPRSLIPIDHNGNKKGYTQSPNACIIMKNSLPLCWTKDGKFPKATKFRKHRGIIEYHGEGEGGRWYPVLNNFTYGKIHSV